MILVPLGPAQRKEEEGGEGYGGGGNSEGQKQETTPLKNTRQKTASTPYNNDIE